MIDSNGGKLNTTHRWPVVGGIISITCFHPVSHAIVSKGADLSWSYSFIPNSLPNILLVSGVAVNTCWQQVNFVQFDIPHSIKNDVFNTSVLFVSKKAISSCIVTRISSLFVTSSFSHALLNFPVCFFCVWCNYAIIIFALSSFKQNKYTHASSI